MSDLFDWLSAQLDWQEDIAQRAKDADAAADVLFSGHCSPNWTLQEVAAKRTILDMYEVAVDARMVAEGTVLEGAAKLRLATFAQVLTGLAAAYRDRPGYQEEWGGHD